MTESQQNPDHWIELLLHASAVVSQGADDIWMSDKI